MLDSLPPLRCLASFRCKFVIALMSAVVFTSALCAQNQDEILTEKKSLKSIKAGEAKPFSVKPAPAGLPDTLSPALRASAVSLMSPSSDLHISPPRGGSSLWAVVRLEFDSAASRQRFRVPGVTVLLGFDRFAEAFVPLGADGNLDPATQKGVFGAPGLVWAEGAGQIRVPPSPRFQTGAPTRAVPEPVIRGGYGGLTGKGVIIAVIDSGIDFRNADFINFDGSGHPKSRLLYFWDTMNNAYDSSGLGTKAPFSYPNGSSIGTLYTREQLSAELVPSRGRIPATDEQGHGTAAAGVAAGNGNNSRGALAGVAPEADLIGVRIGGSGEAMENGYLLIAAIAWVDSVARSVGKPVVFSCSFGGNGSGHNGMSIEEREIDAIFGGNVPGRAIVIAAGNERISGLHTRATYQPGGDGAPFVWVSEQPSSLLLFIHFQTGEPDIKRLRDHPITLYTDDGQTRDTKPPNLSNVELNPFSQDLVLELSAPAGLIGFQLDTADRSSFVADGYLLGGAKFLAELQSSEEIVGSPGTSAGAITVGSYAWNDQFHYQGHPVTLKDSCGNYPMQISDLSCYSSIGYSRDGTVKPDITSPGEWWAAPYAKYPDGGGVNPKLHIVDSSGNYTLFNGTSAATPYTAGIVALMLQKKPSLTSREIKELLQSNASQDALTGNTPNPSWGYGKLDVAAVRAMLNTIH